MRIVVIGATGHGDSTNGDEIVHYDESGPRRPLCPQSGVPKSLSCMSNWTSSGHLS